MSVLRKLSLEALAHRIGALKGWRRCAAAFGFGVMSTLTLAPFFFFPLIVPSFSGLYFLLQAAPTRRRLFWDGWWWGWGYYMTGLYWFCVALMTDVESFGWLMPFALFGLTGIIAIYSGAACLLMRFVRATGIARIYCFSVIWMCVEFARGYWFSGFPWNLIGYSFGFSDTSLQLAALMGAYGLSWYAVLLGTSAAMLLERRGIMTAAAVWASFAIGLAWGHGRIAGANEIPQERRYVNDVLLRLVQGDISQPHKWDPKLQMEGLRQYIDLSQSPGIEEVTHIIWPETAVPYTLQSGTKLAKMLGSFIPPGSYLITGSLRMEGDEANWNIWNSLMAVDHSGEVVGSYDKIRLVPFGEFQPLRDYVPKSWMTPVGDKDFSRGANEQKLDWPGLPPMLPLICYEAIFPEMSMPRHARPKMLLTVTNDAWFGTSSGPYQHFHMARMRAVEQGVPLVRVANTGITAVVDSVGQIVSYMPLGAKGFLDVRLPVSQADPTFYAQYGGVLVKLLIILMIIFILRPKTKLIS